MGVFDQGNHAKQGTCNAHSGARALRGAPGFTHRIPAHARYACNRNPTRCRTSSEVEGRLSKVAAFC